MQEQTVRSRCNFIAEQITLKYYSVITLTAFEAFQIRAECTVLEQSRYTRFKLGQILEFIKKLHVVKNAN